MDFEFTAEETAFRAELVRFLDEEMAPWWRHIFCHTERSTEAGLAMAGKLAERGWLTMSWPEEYGGSASSAWTQVVLREEMWARGEPRGPQYMNVNYIGPMIMKFGSEEQKRRFLTPMSRGEVLWCQGFSEPGAGSDLSAVATRARWSPEEGGYRVDGQKIWTSYADAPAQWCLLVVRSNPDVRPHKGLSLLLVDMSLPGVTVRPIDSLLGKGEINEVFFDDVLVPEDCRLGEQDAGWSMILAGLALERIGVPWYADAERFLRRLVEYAKETVVDGRPLADDPRLRTRIAELYVRCRAARLVTYRSVSVQEKGAPSALESAAAWIHGGLLEQFAAEVGREVTGPLGVLHRDDPDAPMQGWAEFQSMLSIPITIVAGTIDIQRNIVAQQGLGLPRGS